MPIDIFLILLYNIIVVKGREHPTELGNGRVANCWQMAV